MLREPTFLTANVSDPPDGNLPVDDALTSVFATKVSWAVVKLQWPAPWAAGVVVIGAPASVNVV